MRSSPQQAYANPICTDLRFILQDVRLCVRECDVILHVNSPGTVEISSSITFLCMFKTRQSDLKGDRLENRGIDPRTSHMLSERSTI